MNNVLKKIIEKTREDLMKEKRHSGKVAKGDRIQNQKTDYSGQARLAAKRARMTSSRPALPAGRQARTIRTKKFRDAIIDSKKSVALIAEVKLASPSEGELGSIVGVVERVKEYEKAGADAISVVIEKHFFKGDSSLVINIKPKTTLPILVKDFVIDKYQIIKAKQIGADAILIIVKIISKKRLQEFVQFCIEIGIEPIVEIDNEKDIKKATESKAKVIAVNARDLDTFDVSVERARNILKKIPKNFIKLGFSGIKSSKEIEQYKQAGAKGVLVGTSLMKAENIKQFIHDLRY